MKKTLILLLITSLFISCTDKEENPVIERTKEFYTWYETNATDWIHRANAVAGVDNGHYFVDTDKLNNYINWLDETGYFSQSYLNSEVNRWENECVEKMQALRMQGLEADGPPPCVYEGDILFHDQDVILKESIANTNYKLDSITDTYALVDCGASKIHWTSENHGWKVLKIEAN